MSPETELEVKKLDEMLSNVAGYCYYEDMDVPTQYHIDRLLERRFKLTNGSASDNETDSVLK